MIYVFVDFSGEGSIVSVVFVFDEAADFGVMNFTVVTFQGR